jgi:hypothetical protein
MTQYSASRDFQKRLLAPLTVFFQVFQPPKDHSLSLLDIVQDPNRAHHKSYSKFNLITETQTALSSPP